MNAKGYQWAGASIGFVNVVEGGTWYAQVCIPLTNLGRESPGTALGFYPEHRSEYRVTSDYPPNWFKLGDDELSRLSADATKL